MVANMQPSKKISSDLSGAAGPKPMILWPYKKSLKMRPGLVSIISIYILGSCWSELTEITELFPGKLSHKYFRGLHISLKV